MSWVFYVKPIMDWVVRTRIDPVDDPPIQDIIDSWGYRTEWSIGANEGRSRTPGQNQVSQPRVERQRGGVITYEDGEMSIYARRSRS